MEGTREGGRLVGQEKSPAGTIYRQANGQRARFSRDKKYRHPSHLQCPANAAVGRWTIVAAGGRPGRARYRVTGWLTERGGRGAGVIGAADGNSRCDCFSVRCRLIDVIWEFLRCRLLTSH